MSVSLHHHGHQAILTIQTAKLRSFLAILGILVGTAAIVALISCSQLATEKALAQFKLLGTNLISVSVFQQESVESQTNKTDIPLSVWRKFSMSIPEVQDIAPYNTTYQSISFQGKLISGTIIGADETLAKALHIEVMQGRFVTVLESYEQFCVIGADIAAQLRQLSLENPIGMQLQIGHALYTIIGIANRWTENEFFNGDINQAIIVPIIGITLINKDVKVNNAILRVRPQSNIDIVIEQIKHTILMQSPQQSIFIRSAKQIIASMESQAQIFTLLLAVIGGISLLVGGIGVMNVMLVSVNERKKEIGIRKAIGAKNKDIQILFLTESIILSLLGGFLGVVLGLCATYVIAYFSHWPFYLFVMPPFAGFAVSVITGIFFGFYPAYRAARLQPVESLRSE